MLSIVLLQAIAGSKVIASGIDAATNSVHLEINRILSSIIAVLVLVLVAMVKHFISDKKQAVQLVREDMVKEQAINEGAHQAMTSAKDKHIAHLALENTSLKADFMMITKDNTEAFKQVAIKIGSFVEGQAVVAANQERNKSETLLEINRLFAQFFKQH